MVETKQTNGNSPEKNAAGLRKGWTTGACATAATKAALTALLSGDFPDPVSITLPKGQLVSFVLSDERMENNHARAGIIKDAGDDPDVTHLALIRSNVEKGPAGSGIMLRAGQGVGTVTLPGLPVEVGAPAINPVPRSMIIQVVEEVCKAHNIATDITVTLSIPDGENLAQKTWNPRLGIVGGLSILGTTGIVNPFSCSAWIHSIHRGIDVSRATGITHVLGATGTTSQNAAQKLYEFPDCAILDMGDFVGGVLKYLRNNPVDKITLAGGFAKFCKFANGAMDLHSGRSQVDMDWMAEQAKTLGADQQLQNQIIHANTALEALQFSQEANINLPKMIAEKSHQQAVSMLKDAPVNAEILVISRDGKVLARYG